MGTTVTSDVKVRRGGAGASGLGPGGGGPPDPGGSKDWPPGWSHDDAIYPEKYRVGMWVALASILMLFVALTSAYIVRQLPKAGGPNDWVPIDMPWALWVNTAVILTSSITMEFARRSLKGSDYNRFNRWIVITTLLGIAFLIGQIVAWRQLAAQGFYVSTNPHSSFVYLLTSLHAVHLLGGVIALGAVTVAALRLRIGMKKRAVVDVTALYWHFMDGLWVYLFLLLFFWK